MRRICKLLAVLVIASLVFPLFVSCGGKKRPPPLPPTSRPSPKKTDRRVPEKPAEPLKQQAEGRPRIRLLLRENFSSLTVRGSTLAPLLTARAKDGKITLRKGEDVSGETLGTGTGFGLASSDPSKLLILDGSPYRGTIEVFVNPLSVPVVVNEVDLEQYLRGTVPNELHPSRFQQLEALKAQTVAARTFAFYHLGLNVKRGFDVYADERSQVYSGAKVEHPLSDEAIAETSGVIATYDGKPILSVYSSTCGGKTESYAGMFRQDLPYLKGGVECSDEISPYHSWETNCSGSKIESTLNRQAAFGHLRKVETVKKGVSGRIIEMKLTGTKREVLLRGNEIRYTLGIRSNLIEHLDTRKDRDGNITELRVKGKGWGHGVGLCQFGAVHLATKGFGYERILRHYYHDIDLEENR